MRNLLTAVVTTGALLVAASGAPAATVTTTFQVSATVLKSCTVSATNLAFGNYTQGGGAVDVNSTVSVSCTNGTTFTVALNGGTTSGGAIAQRLMSDGAGDTLQYNLYTTNTYATVWGDGSGSSATQSGSGAGLLTPQTLTVFGQLPDSAANKAEPANSYTDTITVTVTY
jgi:spore coat protein U-like protein